MALKPQSPATPWCGSMALCPAAAWPLTSLPGLQPSFLPGFRQPVRARVQQGVQTPGVLEQPEEPQGAVWGPAPSCVCARACPCQLQGQHCTPWGCPCPLCLGFFISFSPARYFRETWCPDSNASKENNQMGVQTGRRAGLEPGHRQQPSVQTLPRSHTCPLPLLAENSMARAGAWGLAAPRSCWWRFS